jgi:murein DD-endopeptidase MepM/ murein hydrolase activator NlpD
MPRARLTIPSDTGADAIAVAVQRLGQTVAEVGKDRIEKADRLAYGAAKAEILSASQQAQRELQDDPDYETAEKRFRERMIKARADAAAKLGDKYDRRVFEAEAGVELERGAGQIYEGARKKRLSARAGLVDTSLDQNLTLGAETDDEVQRAAVRQSNEDMIAGAEKEGAFTPAEGAARRLKYDQGLHAKRTDYLIANDRMDDAEAYYEANRLSMGADDAIKLQAKITQEKRQKTAGVIADNADAFLRGDKTAPLVSTFAPPLAGRVTSVLGDARPNGKVHGGLDLAVPEGTPVQASAPGRVTQVWNDEKHGGGLSIRVDYGGGVVMGYAHLAAQDVKVGDQVAVGDVLGKSGSTGRSTGPHLHWSATVDGKRVDPRTVGNISPAQAYGATLGEVLEYADAQLPPDASDAVRDATRAEVQRRYSVYRAERGEEQDRLESDYAIKASRGELSKGDVDNAYRTGRISPQSRASLIIDIEKDERARAEQAEIIDRIGRGDFLDPKDDKTKKLVDVNFRDAQKQFLSKPRTAEEVTAFATNYVTRVGFVPPSLASTIRGNLRAVDPDAQVGAARLLDAIQQRNPAILNDFSDEDIARGVQLNEMVDLGMAPAAAAQRVAEMEKVPKARREEMLTQYRANTSGTQNQSRTAKAVVADAFEVSSSDLAGLDEKNAGGAQLIADFERLRQQEYVRSGDMALSNKAALALLKKSWAVSYVNGGPRMMKNAPELFFRKYGDAKRDAVWIREQAVSEMLKDGLHMEDAESRFRLIPHPTIVRNQAGPVYAAILVPPANAKPEATITTLTDPQGRVRAWQPNWKQSPDGKRDARRRADTVEAARARRAGKPVIGTPVIASPTALSVAANAPVLPGKL